MDQDIDVWKMIEENNQKMREYLENAEKSMDIPRSTNSMINKAVNKYLMELVSEFKPENGCCFLVKNLTPETNICFVHKITETERIFENIELSDVPSETRIGDILVYTDGKLAISPVVTGEVLKLDIELFVVWKILLKIFKLKVKYMLFVIRVTMPLNQNLV